VDPGDDPLTRNSGDGGHRGPPSPPPRAHRPGGREDIVERFTTVTCDDFTDISAAVGATGATQELLWGRAIANPSVFHPHG
jgi:hypothetical protein